MAEEFWSDCSEKSVQDRNVPDRKECLSRRLVTNAWVNWWWWLPIKYSAAEWCWRTVLKNVGEQCRNSWWRTCLKSLDEELRLILLLKNNIQGRCCRRVFKMAGEECLRTFWLWTRVKIVVQDWCWKMRLNRCVNDKRHTKTNANGL